MAVLSYPKGSPLRFAPAPLEPKFNAFIGTLLVAPNRVYERLRQLEEYCAKEPYCINPLDVRAKLPEPVLEIVVSHLPNDIFSLPVGHVDIPKLRQAASKWEIKQERFLFSIAYDLQKQSGPFFQQLQHLTGLSSDWEQCLALLLDCAKVRRSERRRGPRWVGVTLSDIKTSIQRLEAERARKATERSPDNDDEDDTTETGPESENQTTTQSPANSSAESTKTTSHTKGQDGKNSNEDDRGLSTSKVNLQSTEIGRGEIDRGELDKRGFRPNLDDEGSDTDLGGSSSIYNEYDGGEFGVPHCESDLFGEDDGGKDFTAVGGNCSDEDGLRAPRLEGPYGEEADFTILVGKQVLEDISTQGHRGDSFVARLPADHSFDCSTQADKFNDCNRGSMTVVVGAPTDELRGETSVTVCPDIMTVRDTTVAVEAVCMNAILGRICDGLGPRFTALDSKDMNRIVDEHYQPKEHVAEAIGDADILLLPILLEEDHWVLCTVDRAQDDITIVDIFDPMPSDEHTEQTQKIMNAFIAVYLPALIPGLQIQQCACTQQDDAADSGIYAILFAIFLILKRPLPEFLHVGLWRHIIAAFLDGDTEGWLSLLSWDPDIPFENNIELTDDVWVGGNMSNGACDPLVLAARLRA